MTDTDTDTGSYFEIELQLKKDDNGNVEAAGKLWPVNNLTHSLFKQISVCLNGTLISPQTDTYHYKAFLETLLNYDRDDGETVLKPQEWYNAFDFPGKWRAYNMTTAGDGYAAWQALSGNHKWLEVPSGVKARIVPCLCSTTRQMVVKTVQ